MRFAGFLCAYRVRRQKYDFETQYDWQYVKEFTDEIDSDMKIDGALDESRWQGKKYLTHVQNGVEMRYTTSFSEKGLYIGAKSMTENT